MKIYFGLLLLVLVMVGLPSISLGAPCTPGTDCYCDRVKNPSSPIYDPQLLMCEDFEPDTFHDDVGFGNGAPLYGPVYDHSNSSLSNNRGQNWIWTRRYSIGTTGIWPNGQPASPLRGVTCNAGGQGCIGMKEWRSDDLWQGNNRAFIDIVRNGEFDDEIPSLGNGPTNASGGGVGVFDGRTSLAMRNPAGADAGILGEKLFSGAKFEIGVTQAVAYATNVCSSGLLGGQWKHNEWGNNGTGWFMFHNQIGCLPNFPFLHFIFYNGGDQGICQSRIASAIVIKGVLICQISNLDIRAVQPSQYSQPTDWPYGTWGCVKGYIRGMNSTNMRITITLQVGATEKTIIDFSGLNDDFLDTKVGFNKFMWDNYANANSGTPGYTPTTQTSYRYEDNLHIRQGPPVSCAQIGFTSVSGDTTSPVAPTGLAVN